MGTFVVFGCGLGVLLVIAGLVLFMLGAFRFKKTRRRSRRNVRGAAQPADARRTIAQVAADLTPQVADELRAAEAPPARGPDGSADPASPDPAATSTTTPAADEGDDDKLTGSLGKIVESLLRLVTRSFNIVLATGSKRRRYHESQRLQAAGILLITLGLVFVLATGIVAAIAALGSGGGNDGGGNGGGGTSTSTSSPAG
jgi:hypothetical protein